MLRISTNFLISDTPERSLRPGNCARVWGIGFVPEIMSSEERRAQGYISTRCLAPYVLSEWATATARPDAAIHRTGLPIRAGLEGHRR